MKQTLILEVDPENPEIAKIKIAADLIRKGGLVAFPTETVYGLGANALNPEAVVSLFKAKNRPLDNPPIIHIENAEMVNNLVTEIKQKAKKLMKTFWPGPLTLIFKRSALVPKVTTAGLETIAIRMPNHKVALNLIKESGYPIAAPSANISGKPSPTAAEHVYYDLNGKIDAILDGGLTQIGLESTVVDMTIDPPMLLRPGGTPLESLRDIVNSIKIHPFVFASKELSNGKVRSPGMKYKHYSPNAEVLIVEGSLPAIIVKVKSLVSSFKTKGKKVGVLATDETISAYDDADSIKSLGSRFNLSLAAFRLFRLLRDFDSEKIDIIVAEGLPEEGLGLAVMNRLYKAAAYNIIKAD